MSAKPAASPIEMPSRAASKGRQGEGDTSSSELKPNNTLSHSVSVPPTTAASTRPRRIIRSALANTFALDEQAVATVRQGPSRSKTVATKPASECGVCRTGRCRSAGMRPWSSRR